MNTEKSRLDPNAWRSDAVAMSRVGRKLAAALMAAVLVLGAFVAVVGVDAEEAAAHYQVVCTKTERVWVVVNGSYLDHWATRCVDWDEVIHEHWWERFVPDWAHDVVSTYELITPDPEPISINDPNSP